MRQMKKNSLSMTRARDFHSSTTESSKSLSFILLVMYLRWRITSPTDCSTGLRLSRSTMKSSLQFGNDFLRLFASSMSSSCRERRDARNFAVGGRFSVIFWLDSGPTQLVVDISGTSLVMHMSRARNLKKMTLMIRGTGWFGR